THFRHIAADEHAITLINTNGCYGGIAPVEGDRWNAAFSVPAERVRTAGGNVQRVFDELIAASAPMRQAFANAERLIDWLAAPLPRYGVREDWPSRVIPIGNAAAAIEPIGGEGMGLALASAELAARAILENREETLPVAYRALWPRRARFCRWSAQLLSHQTLAGPSVALLSQTSLSDLPLMRLIGK
ncbi:MAG TPA: hypothetical protein VGB55_12260, partial [Tepidisphaeraceae bacterium]